MRKVSEFRHSVKDRDGRKQRNRLLAHDRRKADKHPDRFYGYYSGN